jgi:hypothetical protein
MLSVHRISPQALYGYYESCGIKSDTSDRILLDPFLIILEIFVTINTPDGTRGGAVDGAVLCKPEGRWFDTRTNEIYVYIAICLTL